MTNKGKEKRRQLFNRFSNQLLLLKEHGLIQIDFQNPDPYLCPICLKEFSSANLEDNGTLDFLTLEDAPPLSLGGSKVALTCKRCNSECGSNVDFHLKELVTEVDNSYFYKGSAQRRTIDFEGKKMPLDIAVDEAGVIRAYHRLRNNNPTLLEKFIHGITNQTFYQILNLDPPPSRVNQRKVTIALLKANYILTFARFGYIFLLDPVYQTLRDQLRNPEEDIFPYSVCIQAQFPIESVGTYYVDNPGLESIFNIFKLQTKYSETIFCGFMNLPTSTFQEYAERIEIQKDKDSIIDFETMSYDHNVDLFENIEEIGKIMNWINKSAKNN